MATRNRMRKKITDDEVDRDYNDKFGEKNDNGADAKQN